MVELDVHRLTCQVARCSRAADAGVMVLATEPAIDRYAAIQDAANMRPYAQHGQRDDAAPAPAPAHYLAISQIRSDGQRQMIDHRFPPSRTENHETTMATATLKRQMAMTVLKSAVNTGLPPDDSRGRWNRLRRFFCPCGFVAQANAERAKPGDNQPLRVGREDGRRRELCNPDVNPNSDPNLNQPHSGFPEVGPFHFHGSFSFHYSIRRTIAFTDPRRVKLG
jgi:hypothetical protein